MIGRGKITWKSVTVILRDVRKCNKYTVSKKLTSTLQFLSSFKWIASPFFADFGVSWNRRTVPRLGKIAIVPDDVASTRHTTIYWMLSLFFHVPGVWRVILRSFNSRGCSRRCRNRRRRPVTTQTTMFVPDAANYFRWHYRKWRQSKPFGVDDVNRFAGDTQWTLYAIIYY